MIRILLQIEAFMFFILAVPHYHKNWMFGFPTCQQFISLVGRVFANGPGDLGSIPRCIIPKTLKIILDTSLLNIQHYKVRIKGKVEQSRERSINLPYTSV